MVGIVGLVVGLPLGIALGRWLWVLFAHQIYAVPTPTVPVGGIVIVAAAAMVLVNLVAVAPGRSAAHTPPARAAGRITNRVGTTAAWYSFSPIYPRRWAVI